jgi:hypothetical protein
MDSNHTLARSPWITKPTNSASSFAKPTTRRRVVATFGFGCLLFALIYGVVWIVLDIVADIWYKDR